MGARSNHNPGVYVSQNIGTHAQFLKDWDSRGRDDHSDRGPGGSDHGSHKSFGFHGLPWFGHHHGGHGHGHDNGHGHGHNGGHGKDSGIELSLLGTFDSGLGETAAEIVAHDPETQRLFVTNAEAETVDILDISDPKHPTKIGSIDVSVINGVETGGPNSVAVAKGIVAVAVEADDVTDPGLVAFYDADGNFLGSVGVGSLPDMLVFTPNGKKLLVANEGEPDGVNPKGSVSIIDLSAGVAGATVTTVDFTAFDAQQAALEAAGLRIFPGELLSDDVEPEYIAVSEDGKTAFITLQEANAVAVLDIRTATITEIQPLGAKDHSQAGNGLDASDDDGNTINIETWPVFGLYMPDAIASYDYKGKTYYVTANEGDDRGETARVEDLTLDPTAFPNAAELQQDETLGRLTVSTIDGNTDGDAEYEALYAYGARSFTIWDEDGNLVFDSGDMIETIIAEQTPELFNADEGDPDEFDNRSDNKGPEPEAVVIGEVNGKTYAFVGLERVGGGVMVFDITKPWKVEFVQYVRTGGDIAPEGLDFISAKDSPIGVPLLVVANEVSGTTSLYQVTFDGKTIKGGKHGETLLGTGGNDHIDGNGGSDKIYGFAGDDELIGGDRGDAIYGGFGDDDIDGEDGNDKLYGQEGDDTIDGGKGNDDLFGGDGDDLLRGGRGNDDHDGGDGTDFVVFSGNRSDYLVNLTLGTVKDQRSWSPDGFDTFENVEFLLFEGGVVATDPAFVAINEVRIDQTGDDADEYFELFGYAGMSLDGLSYIVIGDGTGGDGVVEAVVDLSGYSLDSNGFFVVAESTFGIGVADLIASLNFENGDNVTHMLVRDFTGSNGQDLDTDDDGALDATPWSEIVDSVALVVDPDGGDEFYGDTQVGPDGTFVPGHVFRSPDGYGDWQIGPFNPAAVDAKDTPGEANPIPLDLSIYDIQGAAHRSPYEGSLVRTLGVVTAIASNGFYIQDPTGDGDIATSDGIFVLGSTIGIAVGRIADVTGIAQELQFGSDLSVTRIALSSVEVSPTGGALPDAVVLGVDRIQPSGVIDDDSLTSFDPTTDAIDFLESLEGMLVEVNNPLVVAGTNQFDEVTLVANRGGESGPGIVNAVVTEGDFNPEILLTDDVLAPEPNAVTGDTFTENPVGVMDYTFSAYKLQLIETPTVVSGGRAPEVTSLAGDGTHMTIASYNVLNLDPNDAGSDDDDIAGGRFDAIAQSIINNLGAPDILALQEIQDNSGGLDNGVVDADLTLQTLVDAIVAAGGPTYSFAYIAPVNNADGGAPGANIQNAFLYNASRVQLDSLSKITDDAFEAGGDGTPAEAAYEGTRKPLVGEFTFIPTGDTVTVIGNHLKSKSEDDGLYGENQPPVEHTLPQRVDQAGVINDYVADMLALDPDANLIVLGDMNDFQFSDTLEAMANGNGGAAELINLIDSLPSEEQYSFIFNGNSQVLDNLLVSDNILDNMPEVNIVHANLDGFPGVLVSDHEAIVARVDLSDMLMV